MAEFRLSNFTSGTALTAAELNTGLTYTDYTPSIVQGVAVTSTTNFARYTKFGKMIHVAVQLTCTSSGTSGSRITVSLPVNASSNNYIMGTAAVHQTSCFALYETASTIAFSLTTSTSAQVRTTIRMGDSGTTVTQLVNTNIILFNLTYEAA